MAKYNQRDVNENDVRRADLIDLRSDTVSLPGQAMKEAILSADLGDDVYGEDPSVNQLEAYAANLFAKQAALFVSSGTQSNLVAAMAHCQRGEEILVGRGYHIFIDEAHGASVLGGLALYPLSTDARGALSASELEKFIKPDDFHCAISRLLCLENTYSGHVQPLQDIEKLSDIARRHGLKVHMDGARIFNAQVHSGIPVSELTRSCDSVSVCLSKGLGAPAGSLLIGSQAMIHRARRLRKMLGGGMRQSGILAICGLYALQHNIERLEQDHQHARSLARMLAEIPDISVEYADSQTNMLFINCPETHRDALYTHLRKQNILTSVFDEHTRLVCHLDISDEGVQRVVAAFKAYFTP